MILASKLRTSLKSFLGLTISTSVFLTGGSAVLAQQATDQADPAVTLVQVEDLGSSERIKRSSELRMLSQKIVAASCYLQAGIETDASRELLWKAKADFELITDALEFGNEDLGIIGPEERRRTLAGINKLRELWQPMATLAAQVIDGEGTNNTIQQLAEQSVALRDVAIQLASEIKGQYSSQTSILKKDAFAMSISSRQRMLAQKVSKSVCLIAMGIDVDGSMEELTQSAGNFEAALTALQFGSQSLGIRQPPTQEISDALTAAATEWARTTPLVEQVGTGADIDEAQLSQMFALGNALVKEMTTVATLYSDASKMDL